MPYAVLLASAAERDRKKLPADVRSRLNSALLALELDPRPPSVGKLAGSPDRGAFAWGSCGFPSPSIGRGARGEGRILFAIDDAGQSVRVLRIAHRREAYR